MVEQQTMDNTQANHPYSPHYAILPIIFLLFVG
jgi:hypothetical protein